MISLEKKPFVSIVIPSYLEANGIVKVLQRIHGLLTSSNYDFELILVIDGDSDNTSTKVKELGWSNLRTIINGRNFGKGYSLKRGVEFATATHFIGFIDADGDIDPGSLLTGITLLNTNKQIDLVVGSKLHKDSKINYPPFRRFQSRIYAKLVSLLFKLPLLDTQTGLKIGRSAAMKRCFGNLTLDGFSFDVEMLVTARNLGYKCIDIPVDVDFKSVSTVNLMQGAKAIMDLIILKIKLNGGKFCN